MPWCPKCGDEYRVGFTKCHKCQVELIDKLIDSEEIDNEFEENINSFDFVTIAISLKNENPLIVQSILNNNSIKYFSIGPEYDYDTLEFPITVHKNDYENTIEFLKSYGLNFKERKFIQDNNSAKIILKKFKYIIPFVILLMVPICIKFYEIYKIQKFNINKEIITNKIDSIIVNGQIGNKKYYELILTYLNLYSKNGEVIGDDIFLYHQIETFKKQNKTNNEIYWVVLGAYAIASYQECVNSKYCDSRKCDTYIDLANAVTTLKKYNNEKWEEYSNFLNNKMKCE